MAESTPEIPKSEEICEPVAVAPPPVAKIRHDWYQTETHVVITILAKNVDAEMTKVEIEEKNVSIIR
jgi:suppressor of G2 allele of SKP1